MIRQRLPGKMRTGINLSARGNIRMADKICGGDIVFLLKCRQEMEQAVDLGFGERGETVIVQFYPDRSRIQIGGIAPFAAAGMPSPEMEIGRASCRERV